MAIAGPRFGFDRSVRSYDTDGRLRVETALLTRCCVSDYYGQEIPGYQALGLNPNRIYSLFRPADELRRSVAKFGNLPVLSAHIPVSAADHRPDAVVGASGSNVKFDGVDLTADLVVWAQGAIDAIQDTTARELSVGYAYVPVMTPGTYRGTRYDGIMTDIEPNHIALCDHARVQGAMVGDSKPRKFRRMSMDQTDTDDLDLEQIEKKLMDYLGAMLAPDDLEAVKTILSGGDVPRPEGAMDRSRRMPAMAVDAAGRAVLDPAFMADYFARFPGAKLLKRR